MKSITSIYLLGDKNKGKIGRIKEISNEITFYWNKIKERDCHKQALYTCA